jgi:KaiC/GvpD/RAD55 family RecA-like ATPase
MPPERIQMGSESAPSPEQKREGIILGFPFDQILDRNCRLWPIYGRDKKRAGGIHLPTRSADAAWVDATPGTGNIIICGAPGSGKTTLALQFALACTRKENRAVSAYIALESQPSEIRLKAQSFGWEKEFRDLYHMHSEAEIDAGKGLSRLLRAVLTQATLPEDGGMQCPARKGENGPNDACAEHRKNNRISRLSPTVLVCTLAPRPLEEGLRGDDVFWTRYRQLENLLAAGRDLRKELCKTPSNKCREIFPLLVVDSLNMMAMRMPTRDEMYSLFKLFRTYETIGVFTVEASGDTPFDSTLADVVIRLSTDEDHGYFVRYLEVEKSRYVNQVQGKHPFKTVSPPREGRELTPPIPNKGTNTGDPTRIGVVVFPSLHYIVLRTGEKSEYGQQRPRIQKWGRKPGSRWGIEEFDMVLPHNLVPGSVIVIEGPRHTYKSDMAASFLAKGLVDGESGLLLRLHDQPLLDPVMFGPKINREGLPAIGNKIQLKWSGLRLIPDNRDRSWQSLISSQKAVVNVWEYDAGKPDVYLFEVDFKTGALFPEEFIHVLRDIIIRAERYSGRRGITRAILDDVSEIGSGYPFLQRSKTSGDIFLPALAHIMRNEKIDLVVTGTTREPLERDENLQRICAVADAVVSCRFCSVFGQRHVVVNSEGMAAATGVESTAIMSATPLVVRQLHQEEKEAGSPRRFGVDCELLEGLVGFDTGFVQRPGITIHAFQENDYVHRRYNDEVAAMVEALFNAPAPIRRTDTPAAARRFSESSVSLLPFHSDESEAVHDSLHVLAGRPLDRTVLYTVDEFWNSGGGESDGNNKGERVFYPLPKSKSDAKKGLIGLNPQNTLVRCYYANVLLLAYRKGRGMGKMRSRKKTWAAIADMAMMPYPKEWKDAARVRKFFWFDRSASETLSCALLDALIGKKLAIVRKGGLSPTELLSMLEKAEKDAIPQLEALRKLFSYSVLSPQPEKDESESEKDLPRDAGIYLCWYSQLRDLIDRAPELADRLAVCPLPGGGFRGDWFIGIAKGSVSPQLGLELLEVLCSKKEGYKRFAEGVGLPLQNEFYEKKQKAPAWPRAEVTLAYVYENIYKNAFSRSSIQKYAQFRSALSAICRQLTPLSGLKEGDRLDMKNIVRTLRERIQILAEA